MKAIVVGCLAGVAVTVTVYVGMILNTWTVIHSSWSSEAIEAFYRSVYVAPPLSGVAIGWLAYRLARLKGVE